jgi:hypothetical protein
MKESTDDKRWLEFIEKLQTQADKQIERVWKTYLFIGTCVTILISFGIWFFGNSFSDFKSSITTEVRTEKDIVQRQVTMQIEQEFAKENITKIVEAKARERIDDVATILIKEQLSLLLDPKLAAINGDIETLSATLAEKSKISDETLIQVNQAIEDATKVLENMKTAADVITTILAAQNDDWEAFDQLRKWFEDKTFPLHALVGNVHATIRKSYSSSMAAYLNIPWTPGIDPAKMPLATFQKLLLELDPLFHGHLAKVVWDRSDIPKRERMQFLIQVLGTSKSLTARHFAATFFVDAASDKDLRWEPFQVDDLLAWWEKHKDEIK